MLYLAYISLFFLALQLMNVLLNTIFRQKMNCSMSNTNVPLSVLIPARNESKKLPHLLTDLLRSNNKNLEIIVFDDESTDNTSQLVQSFILKDKRIKLLESNGLPDAWLGKNFACHQLAQKAKGDYLLFLDADVRINHSLLNDSVCYLQKHHLKLLSIFPKQTQKSLGEKVSIPVMNYILLTLLPLTFVQNSPFTSHSAANGQFMLFSANTYRKIMPHKKFKESAIEDIAIARYFKRKRLKITCITSEERIICRMYTSYQEAINGFSKNILMFFGNKAPLAVAFWLFTSWGIVPIIFFTPQYLIFYLLAFLLKLTLYSYVSKQNALTNIVLFPLQSIFLIRVIVKACINRRHKSTVWKERKIYS